MMATSVMCRADRCICDHTLQVTSKTILWITGCDETDQLSGASPISLFITYSNYKQQWVSVPVYLDFAQGEGTRWLHQHWKFPDH